MYLKIQKYYITLVKYNEFSPKAFEIFFHKRDKNEIQNVTV